MEATVVHWGHIGIMEKKMETTGIIPRLGSEREVYLPLVSKESRTGCFHDLYPKR